MSEGHCQVIKQRSTDDRGSFVLDRPAYEGRDLGESDIPGFELALCDHCARGSVRRGGYACRDFAEYLYTRKVIERDRQPRRELYLKLLGRWDRSPVEAA